MEAILYLALAGIALLVPIGSLLGLLAFSQRKQQDFRIEELKREVQALRSQVATLNGAPKQGPGEAEEVIPDQPVQPVVHEVAHDTSVLPQVSPPPPNFEVRRAAAR